MGRSGVPTTYDKELAICRDYALWKNCKKVGKMHQVAHTTVMSIVNRNPDVIQEMRGGLAFTLEERLSEAVEEYVSARGILDPEKLKDATLQQVMTSLAIGIDKLAIIQGAPQLRTSEDIPPVVRALAEKILAEIVSKYKPAG